MSGECDECSEHTVDCKCNPFDQVHPMTECRVCHRMDCTCSLIVSDGPTAFYVGKEWVRERYKEIFKKWQQKLRLGIDEEDSSKIIEDLLMMFDSPTTEESSTLGLNRTLLETPMLDTIWECLTPKDSIIM